MVLQCFYRRNPIKRIKRSDGYGSKKSQEWKCTGCIIYYKIQKMVNVKLKSQELTIGYNQPTRQRQDNIIDTNHN